MILLCAARKMFSFFSGGGGGSSSTSGSGGGAAPPPDKAATEKEMMRKWQSEIKAQMRDVDRQIRGALLFSANTLITETVHISKMGALRV